MFTLTRRQCRAVLVGVTATAAYLGAAELGSKKPVKVSGLFTLASLAMVGMAGASLNNKASVKANAAHQRIDALVPAVATASTNASNAVTAVAGKYDKTGGTISGTVTVTGDHTVNGNTSTGGSHTVHGTLFGNAGVLQLGDSIDMGNKTLGAVNHVSNNGSPVGLPDGSSHGASLIMNGNNGFTFGHITTNQIGPGGTRADLSGTQTLATLTARSNFHNETLNACGVCY